MQNRIFYKVTILFLFICVTVYGQSSTDDCKHDNDSRLSECELIFFDSFFSDEGFEEKNSDFQNKKFAFISAGQLITKSDFFKQASDYRGPKGFNFFNADQKAMIGFDGIIVIKMKTYNLNEVVELIKNQNEK